MKVKYYLRGMGVGIFISTLIFIMAFAFYQPKMSDEEIVAAAKQLGMVEKEDSSNSTDASGEDEDLQNDSSNSEDGDLQNDSSDSETLDATSQGDSEPTASTEGTEDTTSSQTVDFSVKHGQSSREVSQNLFNLGVIDDADSFDSYLNSNGYDNFVQPGNYSIPAGSAYSDVATIITQGKLN